VISSRETSRGGCPEYCTLREDVEGRYKTIHAHSKRQCNVLQAIAHTHRMLKHKQMNIDQTSVCVHLCVGACSDTCVCTLACSGTFCVHLRSRVRVQMNFDQACLFIYIFALPRARIPIQGCGLIEYHFINVAIVLNESAVLDWDSRCACPGLFFPRGIALGENKMRRVTVQVE